MGRYANSTIMREYPDLAEDGDKIYVVLRNPKTMPLDKLAPPEVPKRADGTDDEEAIKTAMYGIMAGMVVEWNVYDANAEEEDSPPFGVPATAEMVAALPFEIANDLMEQITGVMRPPT